MKDQLDQLDVAACDMVEVVGFGGLNDIVKQEFNRDMAKRTGAFNTDDQQQDIVRSVGHAIADHPELVATAVKGLVATFQGQSAVAGFKELRESVDDGKLVQSKLAITVQSTKTLKIESGRHVPLDFATSSDLLKVWERQQDEAEKITYQSGETKRAFRVIVDAMRDAGATTLGELVRGFAA